MTQYRCPCSACAAAAVDDDAPEGLFNELALTVLQQSTLCPLPQAVQPVHWAHEQVCVVWGGSHGSRSIAVFSSDFHMKKCEKQAPMLHEPCPSMLMYVCMRGNNTYLSCCCHLQALHVYPLPHAVVLADASAPQSSSSFLHKGCRVMNPVSCSCSPCASPASALRVGQSQRIAVCMLL